MARHAISWLASQPDAAKMLGALAEPEPPPEPRAPRASRRPESEATAHPFAELAERARLLTERVDSLAVRDERWVKLAREGYTEEGLGEIARFAAHRGMTDPLAAAAALEREVGYPQPAESSGGHRYFHALDRAEHRASDTAFQALMDGDDEQWLAYSVNAALKEIRGQY
jgi:hypothetical protein